MHVPASVTETLYVNVNVDGEKLFEKLVQRARVIYADIQVAEYINNGMLYGEGDYNFHHGHMDTVQMRKATVEDENMLRLRQILFVLTNDSLWKGDSFLGDPEAMRQLAK